MDGLIASIETIKKSQCSLSVEDLIVLDEVITKLQFLKKKKGLTHQKSPRVCKTSAPTSSPAPVH